MPKTNEEKASLYIRVQGRVQQVGFRSFVAQQASTLDIVGWVRNVDRDQVEARAEGKRDSLEIFLEKIRRGPVVARVDEADIRWGEYRGEFKKFRVRWV